MNHPDEHSGFNRTSIHRRMRGSEGDETHTHSDTRDSHETPPPSDHADGFLPRSSECRIRSKPPSIFFRCSSSSRRLRSSASARKRCSERLHLWRVTDSLASVCRIDPSVAGKHGALTPRTARKKHKPEKNPPNPHPKPLQRGPVRPSAAGLPAVCTTPPVSLRRSYPLPGLLQAFFCCSRRCFSFFTSLPSHETTLQPRTRRPPPLFGGVRVRGGKRGGKRSMGDLVASAVDVVLCLTPLIYTKCSVMCRWNFRGRTPQKERNT